MRGRGVGAVVAIVATMVALSIVTTVLFVKPCGRGEGGLRLGGMLVAGCR
jgi:hypothetical protein